MSMWRWIKKAFLLSLLVSLLNIFAIVVILGLTIPNYLGGIPTNTEKLTIPIFITLVVVNLIIKGWLIEKVNIWVK